MGKRGTTEHDQSVAGKSSMQVNTALSMSQAVGRRGAGPSSPPPQNLDTLRAVLTSSLLMAACFAPAPQCQARCGGKRHGVPV
jgi:hypothetical protein